MKRRTVILHKLRSGPFYPFCPCCRKFNWKPENNKWVRKITRTKEKKVAYKMMKEGVAEWESMKLEQLEDE